MVIQDHQRVEDIKKEENFIQGMKIMFIPPQIEAEDTTVHQVPAVVQKIATVLHLHQVLTVAQLTVIIYQMMIPHQTGIMLVLVII